MLVSTEICSLVGKQHPISDLVSLRSDKEADKLFWR